MRKVITSYSVVYPNAIRVSKGTSVTILKAEEKPEWDGWVWCKSDDDQTGWISRDYLESRDGIIQLNRDYDAKEVAVEASENVQVLKEEKGWAWVRKTDGTEGWIPIENLET
jgi:uncharacterized protein YgiM (DUF1202 family)